MLKLVVPPNTQPQSIKDYLRRQAGLSLSAWRKIKNNGILTLNGVAVPITAIVSPGDSIALSWEETCNIEPKHIPLEICFEDDFLMVINKPAGLLVHPTVKENKDTLANGVLFYFREQDLPYSFHPVHRLDRNTSGLILIAKYSHIQNLLSADNIKNIKRIYTAVVSGILENDTGVISDPIGRKTSSIIEREVRDDGQPAVTYYRRLASYKNANLIELELLTGRTHQIRVHLSHIGHPLLGDDLYGGSQQLIGRQALHASKLIFEHPITKNPTTVTSPLPNDINSLLNQLSDKFE
ncbi:RluA family pseudouridine synthase [Dendrosporobacter sp. 1207_IL3150]|uniref:RluA family pseudouridine synthase n=1 Tax=Dendrosporobacter sp. 1207_IL3150 TaxID=3084054 RepID=UPI002FD9CDF3